MFNQIYLINKIMVFLKKISRNFRNHIYIQNACIKNRYSIYLFWAFWHYDPRNVKSGQNYYKSSFVEIPYAKNVEYEKRFKMVTTTLLCKMSAKVFLSRLLN